MHKYQRKKYNHDHHCHHKRQQEERKMRGFATKLISASHILFHSHNCSYLSVCMSAKIGKPKHKLKNGKKPTHIRIVWRAERTPKPNETKKIAQNRGNCLLILTQSINPFSDYYWNWYCWLQSFNNFSLLVCTVNPIQIDSLVGNKNKNHSASLNFMGTVEMYRFLLLLLSFSLWPLSDTISTSKCAFGLHCKL